VEVHFTPGVEAKIQRAATEKSSAADSYVRQLVEPHSWFRQQVKRGLEQLDRGEFLTHEEVGERLEKMFRL